MIWEDTKGKIRDLPISEKLRFVLLGAAADAGIDTVRVTSGGQAKEGTEGKRKGSTRHDDGNAADLQLIKAGQTLLFNDAAAPAEVVAFVEAAAARGATGIGAGVAYMGHATIHVGFGRSLADTTRVVWGPGEKSATAPTWLKAAAKKGWSHSTTNAVPAVPPAKSPGRYVVIARAGLRLRSGPGVEYGVLTTLAAGAEVTVLGFDGPGGDWARVDLQGDMLADGHLHAAFLVSADLIHAGWSASEETLEP